ncbi:FixH family protein [Cohnella xylanilytica]|uniref:FixH family protein n=1 Tax=Cohnella xylanilytica TaxID=557555 RepID=A0A841UBH3_9BACL|nr:FixH family protein [Cohnella xylanilytica]MBB6695504.1 FixH family protein [Cohnella xylanilytica]
MNGSRQGSLWALIAALLAMALLSACSADAGASSGGGDDGRYGIAFSASPETPKLGESVSLTVDVTQGGKPVKGAEVVLELWPQGAEPDGHAQLAAKETGEGSYVLKGEFSQAGKYYVITHVTPKETGQMTMASFEFEIED